MELLLRLLLMTAGADLSGHQGAVPPPLPFPVALPVLHSTVGTNKVDRHIIRDLAVWILENLCRRQNPWEGQTRRNGQKQIGLIVAFLTEPLAA